MTTGNSSDRMKQMSEISRARREERKKAGLPVYSYKTPVEKAKENPTSTRKAINAMCWDCQGGDADPHVSWRIGNCECPDCPLWPVRPHKKFAGKPEPTSLSKHRL